MPTWGNTDSPGNKPKFDVERQVRNFTYLTTTAATTSANTLFFGTQANGQALVANAGIVAGMFISVPSANGMGGNGVAGFFSTNTVVKSVTANTVVANTVSWGVIAANTVVGFDILVPYKASVNGAAVQANTYFQDTILVTPTRLSNALVNVSKTGTGWTHVQRKQNNDGTVRYLTEVLVALASPTASNTQSGNTSSNAIFSGV